MTRLCAAALAALTLFLAPQTARPQEAGPVIVDPAPAPDEQVAPAAAPDPAPPPEGQVVLTARDGSLRLEGELVGFDGAFYRLRRAGQVLTLDAARVTCRGADCPDAATWVPEIRFSGARRLGETLLPALIETFAARQGWQARRVVRGDTDFGYELFTAGPRGELRHAVFHVHLHSSAEGFADLLAGQADVALSVRRASENERALAREAGIGDLGGGQSRVLALDALVPLVSVSNPLRSLRLEALAALIRGEIGEWSDLDGAGEGPVALHLPREGTGQMDDIRARVLDGQPAAEGALRHGSAAALADAVARDAGALGIGSFSEIGNAQALPLEGPCGVLAPADETALKTGDYPLTAPLFVYVPARRLPVVAQDFLRFARSPAAQPVVRRAGFVDQFPRAIPLDQQGRRLAAAVMAAGDEVSLTELQHMVRRLSGHARLTVTFRFQNGAAELAPQSRANVALLADAISRGVFDGRQLLFAGFSDGLGPAGTNRRLARERAETVRDAVAAAATGPAAGRVDLEVAGFGEALPMACDAVEWGREVNRRVEVWLAGAEAAPALR